MAKIYYFLGHEQFQPEVLVRQAKLAEEAGFDGVMVSEHFNPWVADVGASGFAFATLGAIAQQTTNLELLTGVVTPLFRYHPAVVAQAAATIDRLSQGRFSLGVGTGESINEAPLGYHFPAYQERADRMREALQIMHALLSNEKASFQGDYYQIENVKLYSPPVHSIPIFLAAGGPKSATLAANLADGVIVSVKKPSETETNVLEPARKEADKQQRPTPRVIATRWTVYAQDDDEAWQALQAWRGLRAPDRDKATDPLKLQQEADSLSRNEVLQRYTIVKTAKEYLDAYQPLMSELGAEIVVIQTTGSKDQEQLIKFLGSEVVPVLKETKAAKKQTEQKGAFL